MKDLWILLGCLIVAGGVAGVWRILLQARRKPSLPDKSLARLKAHYVRLGCYAPESPCPCGKGAAYQACCRAKDVRKLEADVISHLLKQWGRRSYLGRRQNYTMAARLEEHPLPEPRLPEWVSHPQNYDFPIAARDLLAWSPSVQLSDDRGAGPSDEAQGTDVPL